MVAKETLLSDTDLKDWEGSSLGWQSHNLKIVDKKSTLSPLIHNDAQIKVHSAMELQQSHGLPVQLLIYKARQEGISTKIEADLFEMMNRHENWFACVASLDDDSTSKVFRMCDTFQREMPEDSKRPTVRASAKEIRYAPPHNSSILCQTAGKKVLGRGGTTKGVHATEVCFWANAKKQLVGLLQEVPDEPDTIQVLETTANGTGNEFSKRYWAAVKRLRKLWLKNDEYKEIVNLKKNYSTIRIDGMNYIKLQSESMVGFASFVPGKGIPQKVIDPTVLRGDLPIFLSWQDFPEYRVELPKGSKGQVPGMTPEMQDYVKEGSAMEVSLDPEQIYFALLKVQNKCGGDYDLFKQEYPRTAREAEIATGRMVFRPIHLDEMEKHCKPPLMTVEFYYNDQDEVRYREVDRRNNAWSVWRWPVKTHSYVGFGDVAEGVLSDPHDSKSEPDRSVAEIMDRNWHDIPLVYYGRPDTIEFGDQFLMACKYYNYAWASPEMNSIGQSVLDTFKRDGYQFIYQRETKEDTDVTEDHKSKLGWKTTVASRKPMIADLVEAVKQQAIIIYDIRIIEEMRVFIWNKTGKPEASVGEHDDCVITTAGLLQMHQRCPLNEDLSLADEPKPKVGQFAIAGQVDNDDDELDEDEESLMYEDMDEFYS